MLLRVQFTEPPDFKGHLSNILPCIIYQSLAKITREDFTVMLANKISREFNAKVQEESGLL